MKTARVFRTLAFALSASAGFGAVTQALANGHFARETVYATPVATGWAVPTAFVYPTSYYYPTAYTVPTSYVVPTAYTVAPTSYVVPTYYTASSYYAPTSYYVPTSYSYFFPTAWYEPTVAYLPTVVDVPLVTASTACEPAPTRVVLAAPAVERSAPVRSAPARQPAPAAVESEPAASPPSGIPPVSSRVDPGLVEEPKPKNETVVPEPRKNPGRLDSLESKPEEKDNEKFTPLAPGPGDRKADSPPNPPAAEREPTKKVADEPPVMPAPPADAGPSQLPLDLPVPGETILRKAQKPVLGTPGVNVLNGVVKSGETGDRVEGASVRLTNRLGQSPDRTVETDAYGRFAVRLQDGEWDVQVPMPSGRVYVVSRLTVTNGKIVDDQGRNIPSLVITR